MHSFYSKLISELERSAAPSSMAPHTARLGPTSDGRSPWCQRRGGQPVDDTWPRRRCRGMAASPRPRSATSLVHRAAGTSARAVTPWSHRRWLSRGAVDPQPYGRGDSPRMWCLLASHAGRPPVPSAALESPKPARRARQRGEAAMAQWRDDTCIALNKGRQRNSHPASASLHQASLPCPVAGVPMRRSARRPSCTRGGRVITSRPSARCLRRARWTSTVRSMRSTPRRASRVSSLGYARCPAAWA
jgi:hypothetical protein